MIELPDRAPRAYKASLTLLAEAERLARDANLPALLVELVKIRVSQINGCSYCMRLHSRQAAELGEAPERLYVLHAWRKTSYFDEQERVALEIAERGTSLGPLSPASSQALDADQEAAILWLTIAMNTLNRIAILSDYKVGPE